MHTLTLRILGLRVAAIFKDCCPDCTYIAALSTLCSIRSIISPCSEWKKRGRREEGERKEREKRGRREGEEREERERGRGRREEGIVVEGWKGGECISGLSFVKHHGFTNALLVQLI